MKYVFLGLIASNILFLGLYLTKNTIVYKDKECPNCEICEKIPNWENECLNKGGVIVENYSFWDGRKKNCVLP